MTTKNFKGKKILILGGAYPHKKVVETAKKMELTTYVVDNLEKNKAPAKQIADYSYQIDIFEIDKVINLCREKHIDAVLSCNLDVCQKPYQIICERLKLPCFATSSQLDTLTNKNKFKKICKQYNLDTIQSFTIKEIKNKSFSDFPIFVKPAESSSSYGQTICHDHNEIEPALKFASKTSRNGKVIIEKYMRNNDDVGISGYMIDGHLYI